MLDFADHPVKGCVARLNAGLQQGNRIGLLFGKALGDGVVMA